MCVRVLVRTVDAIGGYGVPLFRVITRVFCDVKL